MVVIDLCNVTVAVSVAELLYNKSEAPYAFQGNPKC